MGNKCMASARFDFSPTKSRLSTLSGGSAGVEDNVYCDPLKVAWMEQDSIDKRSFYDRYVYPASPKSDDGGSGNSFGISRDFAESIGDNFRTKRARTLEEMGMV